MLSREKCIQAINLWKETRTEYSKIKKNIDPTAVFNFTQADCDWLKENNKSSNFHAYAGVDNDKFILIIVPLDNSGKEIDLDSYLATSLTNLKNDITLIETDVVVTVSKTTISKNLEITKRWKEVDLPIYNESTITERVSVIDIEKWKNECLDWFYYECKESKGQNIFRAFTVPFSDLSRKDEKGGEVTALFGFRYSTIYQRQIPILVFVSIEDKTRAAVFVRSNKDEGTEETNTKDWSQPCPPLCKDAIDFGLLD